MKKTFLFFLAGLAPLLAQTGTWQLDPAHTTVQFRVQHLLISEVTGIFREFSGSVELSDDDFTNALMSGTVVVNSIDTDNERRDNHLKAEDFFSAAEYPQMTFKSTTIEQTGKDTYAITGDLTIKNVTKTVTFDAQHGGTVTSFGSRHMGWHASTTINRFDFDVKWDKTLEAGGLIVGETVTIDISAEFVEQN